MSASLASAEWNPLYNTNYRKAEIYTMLWNDIGLDKHIVVGAPFGGPLGTCHRLPPATRPPAHHRGQGKS
jgi:hypothetical protein